MYVCAACRLSSSALKPCRDTRPPVYKCRSCHPVLSPVVYSSPLLSLYLCVCVFASISESCGEPIHEPPNNIMAGVVVLLLSGSVVPETGGLAGARPGRGGSWRAVPALWLLGLQLHAVTCVQTGPPGESLPGLRQEVRPVLAYAPRSSARVLGGRSNVIKKYAYPPYKHNQVCKA